MLELTRYRCNNCGHCFEVAVLTPDERRDAKRRSQPVSPIGCPNCRRQDLREGWG